MINEATIGALEKKDDINPRMIKNCILLEVAIYLTEFIGYKSGGSINNPGEKPEVSSILVTESDSNRFSHRYHQAMMEASKNDR